MPRWLVSILLALVCAAGLAACGGDGGDADPRAVLRETFGSGKEVRSARVDLALQLDTEGIASVSGPLALRLSGPFASTDPKKLPRFDLTARVEASGQSLEVGAISTGEKGYLTVQGQAYELSDDLYKALADGFARQAQCADERDGVSLRALGIDPERWLTSPRNAGTDKVGGADTIHVTAGVDVPRFLEDVNRILGRADARRGADPCDEEGDEASRRGAGRRQLSKAEREAIAQGVKDASVDVWTGEDDRMLRRLRLAIAFEVPEGERAALNGLERGEITFDLTLGALNEDQDIEAPEDARPLSDLERALSGVGGALGGGSGSGGSGSGGSGGAGSGSGGTSSRYLQCLEDAGRDVKKLQACADLVGR
jgi:uncharacterized membrane protein YgcG